MANVLEAKKLLAETAKDLKDASIAAEEVVERYRKTISNPF